MFWFLSSIKEYHNFIKSSSIKASTFLACINRMLYAFRPFRTFLKPIMSNLRNNCNGIKSKNFIKVVHNVDKRTATVVMQKLPVNSFSLEFMEELRLTIKDLEKEKFRGVIITSSSPTVFSAGLDLTELFHPEENRLRAFWRALQELWKTVYISPLITIAAVNGHAPAGGCLLSLSCDYSIMVKSDKSKIGLPATRVGIFAPKWFASMYTNALGFRRAERAVKLGKIFSPKEALKYNIVDELVDSVDELLPKAEKQMDEWLKIPRAALHKAKMSFRQSEVDDLNRYQEDELDEVVKFIYLEETQNNLAKYFENLKDKSHGV